MLNLLVIKHIGYVNYLHVLKRLQECVIELHCMYDISKI